MMARRLVTFVLVLAVLVGVGIGPVAAPSKAVDPATARVDMKILLITNSDFYSGDPFPSYQSWEALLEREGVPYDVFDAGDSQLTYADLADSLGNHAYYQAVVCATRCEASIGWQPDGTTWDPTPILELQTFLADFDIRLTHGYAYPDPDIGLETDLGQNVGGDIITVSEVSPFNYLDGTLTIDQGTFGYYTDVAAGATFDTFVTGPTGQPVIGVHTNPAGYEELVMTIDSGPHQVHALALGHGLLSWLTKGQYLGYNRNYFAAHFDDVFLPDDRWDPVNNTTHEDGGATLPLIRMVPDDVTFALNWQTANDVRLDMVFNGLGSVEEINSNGSDPLTAAFLAVKDDFYWINHTYSHLNLDPPVTQAVIEGEINANTGWAGANGIVIDPTEVVTGEHSGLGNAVHGVPDNYAELGPALTATGVLWVAADNSVQPDQYTIGSATTVPRYPANVFYNTATEAEQLDEYNYLYNINQGCVPIPDVTTCNTVDLTWEEYLDTEASINLPHLIRNDPRPHYFHQSDLTEDRIFYTVFGEVLARYDALFDLPLVQPFFSESGEIMERANDWASGMGSVTAYIQAGAMYLDGPAGTELPITGVDFPGVETYGNQLSGWFTLGGSPVVLDWTAPVITLTGDNPQTIEAGSAYTELGATATDNVDASVTVVPDASAVNIAVPGAYQVTYNATDTAGNAATQVTRAVNVVDTTAPTQFITAPATPPTEVLNPVSITGTAGDNVGVAEVRIEVQDPVTSKWWNDTAWQDSQTFVSAVLTAPNGPATNWSYEFDLGVLPPSTGAYLLSAKAVDTLTNPGVPATSTFKVKDVTPPVITVTGANPQTVEVHTPYAELGATASDAVDGDVTSSIVVDSNAVITTAVGSYVVTYDVMDAAGNSATQMTRTVNVVDTTIPTIILTGANPQAIESPTAYVELGATATDNYDDDGDITADIVIDASAVKVGVPGSYEVTYDVTDTNGNPALQVKRTVIVEGTSIPTITLIGANPQVIEALDPYSELGATANDYHDGDISSDIEIDASAVGTSVVGTYDVTYDVTDSGGNAAPQQRRDVKVVDTTAPVINLNGSSTVTVDRDAAFIDPLATVTDGYEGDITGSLVADASAVNTSVLGSYIVTYNATDASGNAAVEVKRTVVVREPSTGPSVIRLAGSNRYTTAVAVANHHFESEVDAVFIATGESHPDALVAAAPAGMLGVPILLVSEDLVHAAALSVIDRLNPKTIYVIGGASAISESVVSELAEHATVERISGPNRYETATEVSRKLYADPSTVKSVFIATGISHADALVAAAPAGRDGSPILLIPGTSVPAAVQAELARLNPDDIYIVGGTSVVSAEVEAELAAYGAVTRVAGPNRFTTASAVAATFYGDADDVRSVFLATAWSFPDALVAAPPAGRDGVPILLTATDQLPGAVAAQISRLKPEMVFVVGGPAAVSDAVVATIGW